VVQITAFLPSVRELEFPIFEGEWGVSHRWAWWGVLGLCVPWGGMPPCAHRVADYCSVEELEFLLFNEGLGALLQVGVMGSIGLLCTVVDLLAPAE
jgi:hypothetical protein